ncbi:hypothetical protein [Paraburkholderia hayleyella]|uniref:hypothetical protein n=1 Tax=Paraburkholderia hayleyella TaxID=2152889 RepID=UPI0012921CE7|nr:hypothetical protein [Paraburkholderia hayleyella]
MRKLVPYFVASMLGASLVSTAQAHVSLDIGIGLPFAPAYPVYAPPPRVYYAPPPPVVYAPPPVVVGGYYGYGRPYWRRGYYAHDYYSHGYYGHGYYRRDYYRR